MAWKLKETDIVGEIPIFHRIYPCKTGGNIVTSTKIIGCRGELSIYGDPGGERGFSSRSFEMSSGPARQTLAVMWQVGEMGSMDVDCVIQYVLLVGMEWWYSTNLVGMVGKQQFPFGKVYFQVRTVSFREGMEMSFFSSNEDALWCRSLVLAGNCREVPNEELIRNSHDHKVETKTPVISRVITQSIGDIN